MLLHDDSLIFYNIHFRDEAEQHNMFETFRGLASLIAFGFEIERKPP